MTAPRKVHPMMVGCEVCGALPYLACMPSSTHPMGSDLLHRERVLLSEARTRMNRRARSPWGRLMKALRRG